MKQHTFPALALTAAIISAFLVSSVSAHDTHFDFVATLRHESKDRVVPKPLPAKTPIQAPIQAPITIPSNAPAIPSLGSTTPLGYTTPVFILRKPGLVQWVGNASSTVGQCFGATGNSSNTSCYMTMSFTFVNPASNDVYVSKNPSIALATSSTPFVASTTILETYNMPPYSSDTRQAYDIPSNGSRNFTFFGIISAPVGGGFENFKITAVHFGAGNVNGADSTSTISSGLDSLSVSQTF